MCLSAVEGGYLKKSPLHLFLYICLYHFKKNYRPMDTRINVLHLNFVKLKFNLSSKSFILQTPLPDSRDLDQVSFSRLICGSIEIHLFLCWCLGALQILSLPSLLPTHTHPKPQLFFLVLTSAAPSPLRKLCRAASWTISSTHFCKGLWQQLPLTPLASAKQDQAVLLYMFSHSPL